MNTQQLKELAKLADSEVTWILLPKDLANDGWCTEVVNYISVVSPSSITALVDRIEEAERERDELKQRLANAEHQLHVAELAKFNLRNQRKAQFRKRREAEAELARRDAASGEPDYWQFKSVNGDWIGIGESGMRQAVSEGVEVRPLYTAALPAVLPYLSDDTLREMVSAYNIANHSIEAYQEMRAAMGRGAQQQKVVELPNVYTWSNSEVVYLAALKQALDAAGVKWEVKS